MTSPTAAREMGPVAVVVAVVVVGAVAGEGVVVVVGAVAATRGVGVAAGAHPNRATAARRPISRITRGE
jgi:hypothetical protein